MPNDTSAPAVMPYNPAPSIAAPAMPWQMPRSFCAGMNLSATIPMRVGMNMDTMPCIA